MSNKNRTSKAKSVASKEENKGVKSNQTMIYCGPPLRNLTSFAVFSGELPEYVQHHIKKCSAIKELLISPSDFTRARKNFTKKGSRENQLFNKVLEYSKGGK